MEEEHPGEDWQGLSAGGYGAVDIGLRHPGLFSTLEAWIGYFHPLGAGALVHADAAGRRAHGRAQLPTAVAYAFPTENLDSSTWTSSSPTSSG